MSCMRTGRPVTAITLIAEEETQLRSLSTSRTLPHAVVARAKLVLWAAQGKNNTEIADRLYCTKATVGKWRQRFVKYRLAGLYDKLRPGRPRSIEDDQVAALLNRTLSRKSKAATHWSVRLAAQASGISKSTVHRVFQAFAVQPHRTRSFKLSSDPFFVDKVRDIVGLYLNPPDNALVLCVDEKSQIQALDRTQPVLPMGLGYVEGVTHDYVRHGTTTLFVALDVASGTVFAESRATSSDRGQLRHPQTCQGAHLAGKPPALSYPLHSHLLFLAESGGTLVRLDHPTSHPSRFLPQRQATDRENRCVCAALQPFQSTLRMDSYC